jgi:hypothetical protein
MIPEAVRDPVAQGAIAIRACNGNTEPHAEKHAKKGSIQVKPKGFRRPGQQPRPGARLLKKLKVCPLGFSFGRHLKRVGATRTAFGSMRSSCQAGTVLETAAALAALAKHCAHALRAT